MKFINLYNIILQAKDNAEGYIIDLVDKILGIMRLWIEVGYYHNYCTIKTICSVYQDRFKKFLKIENINELKNKSFYIDLLRESYIYIKEHLTEIDTNYFLKYFTQSELESFREEIKLLKNNQENFLN